MVFSTPTTDVAFKKLFGSRKHTYLTMSFLNSVLEKKEGELITSVVINDNANVPMIDGHKASFVDVSCTDQAGRHYIVEMQVNPQKDFLERAQHYAAFRLANQLTQRNSYDKLMPVIFVAVLDFQIFDEPDYLTHLLISNTKTHKQAMFHLEFHFVELKKFKTDLERLKTMVEYWTFFLKAADSMKSIPRQMKLFPELVDAFDILIQDSWTKKELDAYHKELDHWRVEQSILKTREEIGLEKGIEKGIKRGIEIGIEKGIEKGIEQRSEEIVQTMLAEGFDVEVIARVTKLSVEEIKQLKARNDGY